MVWVVWHGLQRLRFAIQPDPPELPLWSIEVVVVLVARMGDYGVRDDVLVRSRELVAAARARLAERHEPSS
jgi:hypothetical protein